ncbi:LysR family transcriptional regulator [Paraburkholderia aromaticivorans]|uniref:LysR family transcriptional regulator n=1 Tax=Paraburkholderia aromaticivorans TaxID=2026199 RepID=UPI0014561089|nr:LysR family transcriptional regulator [Paraburkholderia aromaticivorans]
MDTFTNMRIFTCVAEQGSFTAAARRLNIAAPAVTRSISALETRLRTRLLNRTTRKVALTESGMRYLRRCEEILAIVDHAEAEAADSQIRPTGQLHVHATTGFGQSYVVPAIVRYKKRYPFVSVNLTLSQHQPDILDEGYDVSIQLTVAELPDSSLVAHRLGTLHSSLCAAPAYLREYGTPRDVDELSRHACFQLVSTVYAKDRWLLEGPDGIETVNFPEAGFRTNVAEALSVALKEGIGIGALPMSTAASALRDGSLVRILPAYRLQPLAAYALYTSRRYLDAKIRTFVEFLQDVIPPMLEAHRADFRETAYFAPAPLTAEPLASEKNIA